MLIIGNGSGNVFSTSNKVLNCISNKDPSKQQGGRFNSSRELNDATFVSVRFIMNAPVGRSIEIDLEFNTVGQR